MTYFKNRREQWLVLIGLVLIFILPFFNRWLGTSREDYLLKAESPDYSASFLHRELYEDSSPIDIAFVGPCTTWWQLNVGEILKAWPAEKPKALIFGYNHYGEDLTYIVAKEILSHRPVKLLVISTPRVVDQDLFPHPTQYRFLDFPADIKQVAGLSFLDLFKLYGVSVAGVFMRLPTAFQSNLKDAGRLAPVDAFGGRIRDLPDRDLAFRDLGLPAEKMIFNSDQKDQVEWISPVQDRQRVFLNEITEIAKQVGTRMVFLNSPFQSDWSTPRLKERANGIWVDHPEIPLIGVNPAEIAAHYNSQERDLFFDEIHLHPRGAAIFSRWIGPAIRKIYESN